MCVIKTVVLNVNNIDLENALFHNESRIFKYTSSREQTIKYMYVYYVSPCRWKINKKSLCVFVVPVFGCTYS